MLYADNIGPWLNAKKGDRTMYIQCTCVDLIIILFTFQRVYSSSFHNLKKMKYERLKELQARSFIIKLIEYQNKCTDSTQGRI